MITFANLIIIENQDIEINWPETFRVNELTPKILSKGCGVRQQTLCNWMVQEPKVRKHETRRMALKWLFDNNYKVITK